MATPQISVSVCERFLDLANKPCPAPSPTPAVVAAASEPEWDALATSLASIGNAFAMGSLLIGVLALFAAIGWGLWVKKWAEDAAKAEARIHARAMVEEWCRTEAPQIIRRHLDNLQNTSLGRVDDGEAADEMGEEAG